MNGPMRSVREARSDTPVRRGPGGSRRLKRLVVALLVIVGVLVAVDFAAAALAESAVSREMRQELGLADDPSVNINGFPFLTQAASGHYSSIDVDAQHISVGPFRDLEVTAHLSDVTAPLPMLLGSGPKTVEVGKGQGTVRVSAADLQRLMPQVSKIRIETVDEKSLAQAVQDGADASVAQLDPDRTARLVGTVDVLGQPVEIAVLAELQLAGSGAVIAPVDVRMSDGTPLPLPSAIQRSLLARFRQPLDVGGLPLQVTPRTFRAVDGVLQISGTASALTIGGTG